MDKAADQSKSSSLESKRVGSRRSDINVLEEVGAVVYKANTAEDLASGADTSDFCAAELKASEAVPVTSTNRQLLFEVIGIDDSSECAHWVDMCSFWALETTQRLFGFVETVHANDTRGSQVPGR